MSEVLGMVWMAAVTVFAGGVLIGFALGVWVGRSQ